MITNYQLEIERKRKFAQTISNNDLNKLLKAVDTPEFWQSSPEYRHSGAYYFISWNYIVTSELNFRKAKI